MQRLATGYGLDFYSYWFVLILIFVKYEIGRAIDRYSFRDFFYEVLLRRKFSSRLFQPLRLENPWSGNNHRLSEQRSTRSRKSVIKKLPQNLYQQSLSKMWNKVKYVCFFSNEYWYRTKEVLHLQQCVLTGYTYECKARARRCVKRLMLHPIQQQVYAPGFLSTSRFPT